MDNENNDRLKNVDEGLNQLILDKYSEAITNYSNQDYDKCYNLLKTLYFLIQPYDFDRKEDLKNIIESIEEFKLKGNSFSVGKAAIIEINKKKYKFSFLVDEVYRELPKAFASLGKWMAVIKQYNDIDLQISDEVFNTDVSLIKKKREELESLSSEYLLTLMSNNMVNAAHSRYLIKEGV